MGFALWMRDELTWAMGTHEYRPMGIAIISASDYFRPRDFHRRHQLPSRDRSAFVGFFASIDHLNQRIESERRLRKGGKKRVRRLSAGVSLV
ncbi:MAG TPA: hypothetical protein VM120_29245 [Bryobacteraceae bacterium]|nr:hypothetical protein [Bryobacteraceae bacterium]